MSAASMLRWITAFVACIAMLGCARPVAVPAAPPKVQPSPDLRIVIPPGAAAAELRGEPVVAIPPEIRLEVGQAIVIRNDDRAMHYFFEEPIAPGQTLERRYDQPGRYRYTGVRSCSVGGVTGLLVEVVPIEGGQ